MWDGSIEYYEYALQGGYRVSLLVFVPLNSRSTREVQFEGAPHLRGSVYISGTVYHTLYHALYHTLHHTLYHTLYHTIYYKTWFWPTQKKLAIHETPLGAGTQRTLTQKNEQNSENFGSRRVKEHRHSENIFFGQQMLPLSYHAPVHIEN